MTWWSGTLRGPPRTNPGFRRGSESDASLDAEDGVASDPDLAVGPRDVNPPATPQGGALSGDVGDGGPAGADQPLCDPGVEAAGHGILAEAAAGHEGPHLGGGVRGRRTGAHHPDLAERSQRRSEEHT